MIAFTNNVFISNNEMVQQCGALASFKFGIVADEVVRPEDVQRFAAFNDNDGLIFVAPYLAEALTPDELGAIIAHEQGHINLGHLEKHKDARGIVDDMEIELEADAHAVALFGARTVRAAIGKTLSAIIAEMAEKYDVPKGDKFKIYKQAATTIRPRIVAIRAAM